MGMVVGMDTVVVGIVAGAYSSIFLASPLLTYFVPKSK
jgi:preprotein translocase subunit SecF